MGKISQIEEELISSLEILCMMGSRNHYVGLCHAPSQPDHVMSLAILKNIFLSRPYMSHFFHVFFLVLYFIKKSVIVFYLKSLCPHNIMCLALFAPGVVLTQFSYSLRLVKAALMDPP